MGIEKYFETSQTPHLIIDQVHGNMVLRGWGESRIMVSGNGNDFRFSQEGDEIRLGDFDDCRVMVPYGASVTTGDIHGNAHVTGIRGQLTLKQCHGNLHCEALGAVRFGRIDGEFSVRDVAGPLVIDNIAGNFNVGDIKGNVQVEHIAGNCSLRQVDGQVLLQRVRGNLSLHGTQAVHVEKVEGNMNVRASNGGIQVTKVGGNLSVVESMGDLNVESVGGDLRVRQLMGGLNAEKIGGTAHLHLQELAIPFVTVHAGGDIRCRLPLALNARVELRAGNDIVIKNLPLPDQWESRNAIEYTLGNGEGRLELVAGNRIKLVGSDGVEDAPEWDSDYDFRFQGDFNERATELVQQVAEQVEAQVEAFTRQLNERLSALDNSDDIAAKVQQKVQSAMRQAEEKISDAMRRAERHAERQAERYAARDVRQRGGGRGMPPASPMPPMPPMGVMAGGPGTPPMPRGPFTPTPPAAPAPKPKRNPPSAEERMLVLKMLEEGKISVEQAEKLLSAMGE